MKLRLGVVGAGNMGTALVAGIVSSKALAARSITVTDVDARKWALLGKKYAVRTAADNQAVARWAQALVLCVKPQQVPELLKEVGGLLSPDGWVMSVAAGIQTKQIEAVLGRVGVVRVMPNTPALMGAGALVYCLGRHARRSQEIAAVTILSTLGKVWKTTESHMDAVTALSGSGPAYVFYLAECLVAAGTALGLPAPLADALARQTVWGAGRMLAESSDPAGELRRRVTSPGGTTEAALKVLTGRAMDTLFKDALAAACRRSKELSTLDKEMKT
ncbi:MAG: pyrroline-5-carboxylate reductase [Elusimicrobia bacterium]|nr:pyrroline-5-carboxylate reductase [Elusimicrobiota bacterium]MBP9127594.1 pyrroline-5-carboxylate reductase [Elusimicrobiota bacterium]